MKQKIAEEVKKIIPLDDLEQTHLHETLEWIKSGAGLCRIEKPAIPSKHLVSYFVVIDGEYILLVDHINAQLWLPTGGHVERNEHPQDTVKREAWEELRITANFLLDRPIMLTSTETVGKTAGHTDVSLWYLLRGNRKLSIDYDKGEFNEVQWFHTSKVPFQRSDPHMKRFVEKLCLENIRD